MSSRALRATYEVGKQKFGVRVISNRYDTQSREVRILWMVGAAGNIKSIHRTLRRETGIVSWIGTRERAVSVNPTREIVSKRGAITTPYGEIHHLAIAVDAKDLLIGDKVDAVSRHFLSDAVTTPMLPSWSRYAAKRAIDDGIVYELKGFGIKAFGVQESLACNLQRRADQYISEGLKAGAIRVEKE
ncbi:hypothetical protein [Rosistilla oblonga]|uniref:hypothetical protein n=1 Tax=Rosistilla oblonga TaxID=2527990 RepID=UPI003A982B5C